MQDEDSSTIGTGIHEDESHRKVITGLVGEGASQPRECGTAGTFGGLAIEEAHKV
jgi:hypothetical protein